MRDSMLHDIDEEEEDVEVEGEDAGDSAYQDVSQNVNPDSIFLSSSGPEPEFWRHVKTEASGAPS